MFHRLRGSFPFPEPCKAGRFLLHLSKYTDKERNVKVQYRKDRKGENISVLGYGCMRFARKGVSIDLEKAETEVMEAIRLGVNYFDTAYIYPGSEAALGEILERNGCRKQVKIATKLPHYLIKSRAGAEKLFSEQLKRLRTDYVDYYLMHMLGDVETWEKLKKAGIESWIREKTESGQIRNIGFSYHGSTDGFCRLVDAYDWDFCQIQYNYVDENSQAGRKGLMYASEKGLPVIIMEPLRGGKLVNLLPESAKELFFRDPHRRTPAEMAFKWLYDQKQVTCVLSGMNSLDMVHENVKTASEAKAGCLTLSDRQMIDRVKEEIARTTKVGCTGCGYCMPCPAGVDIPGAFRCYNAVYEESRRAGRHDYLFSVLRKKHAGISQCVGCGRCETHCPQGISIRSELKNAAKELEGMEYKLLRLGVKLFRMFG